MSRKQQKLGKMYARKRREKQRENGKNKRLFGEENEVIPFFKTYTEMIEYYKTYSKTHGVECKMDFEEWKARWDKRKNNDAIFHRVPGSYESASK